MKRCVTNIIDMNRPERPRMTVHQIKDVLYEHDPCQIASGTATDYGRCANVISNFCTQFRDPTREILSRKIQEVLDLHADPITCNHIARDILHFGS